MEDRQTARPGRVKLTLDDGTIMYGVIERADEPTVVGTPINKNTLFNSNNSTRYDCELPSEALEKLTREVILPVPMTGWSSATNADGYYTQTIAVDGMSEQFEPIFSLEVGDAAGFDPAQEAFALIPRAITSDGAITFCAIELPEADISIRVRGV